MAFKIPAEVSGEHLEESKEESDCIRLEAITGKQEAKFALLGSLDLIDPEKDFAAVIDIVSARPNEGRR